MNAYQYFGKILNVDESLLANLGATMAKRTGRTGVFEKLMNENEEHITHVLKTIGVSREKAFEIHEGLRKTIVEHEKQLDTCLQALPGKTEFDKSAAFAKKIAHSKKGFFLKKDFAKDILRKRRPDNLLKFLGYKDVEELFEKSGIIEAFSALRFIETDEWMHKTFEEAYSNFSVDDFEERDIQIEVLGSEWHEVAKKFVEKKHHNVSHLKEFGIIFINPIKEDVPGKLLRDSALLLHYIHEIEFYSKLFKKHSQGPNFTERLKSLLRGDVPEQEQVQEGQWLIIQRYLFKEDPKDPRLFLPRVNPESLHWGRGERDLVRFAASTDALNLELWNDLDWVAGVFNGELISFDMEDNAMSAVSFGEKKKEFFTYHQREALWTKFFSEYAGGEEKMEQLLVDNFEKKIVRFS